MADDFSPLARGIRLMLRMELDLSPEQFLAWLNAQPGAPLFYKTFVAHHIEEPTEQVITPTTLLKDAFPGLAKHYGKPFPQQQHYRPNGDASHGYL